MDNQPNDLRDQVLDMMPALRAFARSLTHNPANADDLVQETLLKALTNGDKFTAGTNLRAWLFTILRNSFYSSLRKTRNEVADASGELTAGLSVHPAQEGVIESKELRVALHALPAAQREALMLVGVAGLSYEDAAQICGCAIGTMKSRVNRARNKLMTLMHYDDIGSVMTEDQVILAASH